MSTKIYGASDDLVEFEGDIDGEVGCYGTDDRDNGVLVVCSDGTMLDVQYGKADMAVWGITVIKKGTLFERVDPCCDEDENPHSDVAHFTDGLRWAYSATEWAKVR